MWGNEVITWPLKEAGGGGGGAPPSCPNRTHSLKPAYLYVVSIRTPCPPTMNMHQPPQLASIHIHLHAATQLELASSRYLPITQTAYVAGYCCSVSIEGFLINFKTSFTKWTGDTKDQPHQQCRFLLHFLVSLLGNHGNPWKNTAWH